ncbi:MAG: HipA domain-containing protein [Ferruginibacter sp.]|nr:HipA domain-containing protein [Ferruginibacter sp.]
MKNYKNKNPLYSTATNVVNEPQATYFANTKNCLYCYNPMQNTNEGNYHIACCKKFFGQAYVPTLDYDKDALKDLANKFLKNNMAVSGVQPKVSLSWYRKQDKNVVKKLTIVGLYGDYILKPPSDYYNFLPEVEDCTMHMAKVCGLQTVPHTLFYLKDNTLCYLTKRVDRSKTGMYHMEDMCQLTERLTEDKYKGSHEQVAKAILKYSATPMLDVSNFYEYVLFSFFTGNADMHLKNFSLLETNEKGKYTLAPAYDMLNTTLVNKKDTEELALTLNGKKNNLNYKDFLAAFTTSGLSKKVLDKTLENFYYCSLEMKEMLHKSFLPTALKNEYEQLLHARMKRVYTA